MKLCWKAGMSQSELQTFLDDVQSGFTWFYGERLGEIQLSWASELADFGRWQHGIIFNSQAELAWWQQDGTFAVRWMGAKAPAQIDWDSAETATAIQSDWAISHTRLHGRNDGTTADWAEARIPRRFTYPLPTTEGAQLPAYAVLLTETLWLETMATAITRLCAVADPTGKVELDGP